MIGAPARACRKILCDQLSILIFGIDIDACKTQLKDPEKHLKFLVEERLLQQESGGAVVAFYHSRLNNFDWKPIPVLNYLFKLSQGFNQDFKYDEIDVFTPLLNIKYNTGVCVITYDHETKVMMKSCSFKEQEIFEEKSYLIFYRDHVDLLLPLQASHH